MKRVVGRMSRIAAVVLFAAAIAGCVSTGRGQPHMQAALDELQAARAELERADSDKGGHRVKAIAIIDDAISQVEQGIEFARGRR